MKRRNEKTMHIYFTANTLTMYTTGIILIAFPVGFWIGYVAGAN